MSGEYKNKPPAFQFYAQDFLTGCVYLTDDEIGKYVKMLCKQWTDGKIPLKRLEFLIGKKWEDLSDELREKFQNDGEFIFNIRLEKEREKMRVKSEIATVKAKKRWAKNDSEFMPQHMPQHEKKNATALNQHKNRICTDDAFLEDEIEIENEIIEKGGVGEKTENNPDTELEKIKAINKAISDELKISEQWIETMQRNYKLTADEVKTKLDEFNESLSSVFKCHPSKHEYLKHFGNWIRSVQASNIPQRVGSGSLNGSGNKKPSFHKN